MPEQTHLKRTEPLPSQATPQPELSPEEMAQHPSCDVGVIGLGPIGRNYALNLAEHGFHVTACDYDLVKVEAAWKESEGLTLHVTDTLNDFLATLKSPRIIFIILQAGSPVDRALADLLPHLKSLDLVIDGSNSHFEDTDVRATVLLEHEAQLMSLGISGGEEGVRHGPCLMVGGAKDAFRQIEHILEETAAKINGDACLAYVGASSSGHYAKIIHTGIEYALTQLIAESYNLMKQGLELSDDELSAVYQQWDDEELQGYLLAASARIFRDEAGRGGRRPIDAIHEEIIRKGTGRWMAQDAMELNVPTPTVDAAVAVRSMSKSLRESDAFERPDRTYQGDRGIFLDQLRNALYAAMVIAYAQGMAQLQKASAVYEYGFDLEDMARIWRAGSTIRSAIVPKIRAAFHARMDLPNLLADPLLGSEVIARHEDLRAIVRAGLDLMIPVPALAASAAYFDSYFNSWSPANFIQAQHEDAESHMYGLDAKGTFYTQWISI